MKKTIIVPTDFTVKSLNLVVEVLKNSNEDEIDIILLHAMHLPTSITDLLFFSKQKVVRTLETERFKTSCNMLKNHYGNKLSTIKVETFTGYGQRHMRLFVEALKVDDIYVPQSYKLKVQERNSYDPSNLLKKAYPSAKFLLWQDNDEEVLSNVEDMSGLFFSIADK